MKKFFVLILALTYLTTSIGATMHFHYCMDKLVEWGLGHTQTKVNACPYCGMDKTDADKHCGKQFKGCCHDEQKQVKIEKDQKTVDLVFHFAKPFLQNVDHSIFDLSTIAVTSPILDNPVSHSPPRTENISLFLRNSVFRI
jgi:hypothetical protein